MSAPEIPTFSLLLKDDLHFFPVMFTSAHKQENVPIFSLSLSFSRSEIALKEIDTRGQIVLKDAIRKKSDAGWDEGIKMLRAEKSYSLREDLYNLSVSSCTPNIYSPVYQPISTELEQKLLMTFISLGAAFQQNFSQCVVSENEAQKRIELWLQLHRLSRQN